MSTHTGSRLESQVQRLASNGVALAAGGIVAQLAFTFLEILVARKLGAEAYGVFVTAYAWTVLGAFLMEFGTPLWTVQEGSRNHERIPRLLGSGLTVNFALFVLLYLLVVVAANTLAPNPVLGLLVIILPYGLILTLQAALAAVYSSYQTMHVNAFFQGIAPVAVLLTYLLYAANDLNLAQVGYSYVLGSGIVTGVWFVLTLRRVRPRFSSRNLRATLSSSYQYGLTGILGHVYYRADVILLSLLAGLREAGIYAAAFKLVELVYKVAVLSGRVFSPAMFKASHESDKAFQILSSMMTRSLAIAGLTAGVITFVTAEELILFMFGEKYAASVPVLRVLGGVMAARCMMIALQVLLSSIDLHFQRVAGLGITVIAHIGASAFLIPRFGAQGAAWAALSSGVVLLLLYGWSSSRQGDFRHLRRLLVPSCLAAIIAATASIADANVLTRAVVSVAAFFITLFIAGLVRRDEVSFVVRSVFANGRQ